MGEVNISPGFTEPALVSLSGDHGYASLGRQTFAWDFSLPQAHLFHVLSPSIQRICRSLTSPGYSCGAFLFFSPGNPVRILQSGNNKICMIHQCSLNVLAFAALHLTSCSLSVLARNSLGHGACP